MSLKVCFYKNEVNDTIAGAALLQLTSRVCRRNDFSCAEEKMLADLLLIQWKGKPN